jgi:hypothetical protein
MEIGRTTLLEKPNGLSFGALYGLDSAIQSLAKLKRIQRYFVLAKSDTKANSSKRSDVPRSMHKATVGSISKRCSS